MDSSIFKSVVLEAKPLSESDNKLSTVVKNLSAAVSTEHKVGFDHISNVAVIGAGAMGRCIAIALARLNKNVSLIDANEESLQAAKQFIQKYIDGQLQKEKLNNEAADKLFNQFQFSLSLSKVADSQLVVEAVPEILSLKQSVMKQLEALVDADCILATNTSTLDLDAIANSITHSERVIGTHFFIPAHVTRLLEIVPAEKTSAHVRGIVEAMALAMNKVYVIAGNCDGFIGNRLFDRFHQEAMYLLEEGATPQQVDTALETWGMVIGPFRALDMVGNDIPWQVRCQRKEKNPATIQPRIGDALCEQGRFGQKTGSGWYDYQAGSRQPLSSEQTTELLEHVSKVLGHSRRTICDDEIVGRCILALVNKGCAIVREGFAQSTIDIDLAYVNGYGFPADFGGPMQLADNLGLARVIQEMDTYRSFASHGETLWQADALLRDTQQNNKSIC